MTRFWDISAIVPLLVRESARGSVPITRESVPVMSGTGVILTASRPWHYPVRAAAQSYSCPGPCPPNLPPPAPETAPALPALAVVV